jgi:hypothetical protein
LHGPIRPNAAVSRSGLERSAKQEGVVKNLISIGKFLELSELSIRALRLYDELGVLKPTFIDPDTNSRRYGLDRVNTALRIRAIPTRAAMTSSSIAASCLENSRRCNLN